MPNTKYSTDRTLPMSDDSWIYLKEWEKYRLMRVATGSADPIERINRFSLMTDKDEGFTTKRFIFMTKPDLNLFTSGGELTNDIAKIPLFNYVNQLPVGRKILESLSFSTTKSIAGSTPWLSALSNYARSYPIQNEREIETVEVGKTFHDFSINYGHTSFKHMTSGNINIDFKDNRDMIVYWTLRLWCEYIHAVSYGLASPKREYIYNAILDYAVALYYIVTDETMENILYWEKLTGLFPVKGADQTWAWESADDHVTLNYSMEFKYSMRSVLDEFDLVELNNQYRILNNDAQLNNVPTLQVDKAFNAQLDKNSGSLKMLIAWFNRIDTNTINQEEMEKYYYSNTDKSVYTRFKNSNFLPNYIPELGIHGIPYVKGPFIVKNNDGDAATYGKNILRWV